MAAAAPKSDYRSLVENAPLAPDDARAQTSPARDAAQRNVLQRDISQRAGAPNRFVLSEEISVVRTAPRANPHLRRARREELHFDSHPDTLTPHSKRDRQRAKHHRPIRLTWSAVLCVAVVMAQLVLLLRMNARALEASQQAGALEAKIIETSDQIERTQQRISVYDSSAHLAQWAQERGWKQAGHLDIDDVTRAGLAAAMPTPGATAKPDAYFIEGQTKNPNEPIADDAIADNAIADETKSEDKSAGNEIKTGDGPVSNDER